MNRAFDRRKEFISHSILFLKKHHQHVMTIDSTNRDDKSKIISVLFFDLLAIFVTYEEYPYYVRTLIYEDVCLKLMLNEGYKIHYSRSEATDKNRIFLPAQQAQQ